MKTIIFSLLLFTASILWAAQRLPVRGMSMDDVIQQSGEPRSRKDAVGNPPITRWTYQDYSVYFEGNTVIHSVKNNKKSID